MRIPVVVDPRRRLRIGMTTFIILLAAVFLRAVHLEVSQGAAYRDEAMQPLRRETSLPGVRARVLASDGTVLAQDEKVTALAIHYRWLQEPPNEGWLRQSARRRLSKSERRNTARLAEEQSRLIEEKTALHRRLAELCGLSDAQWTERAREIQTRVEQIADRVNRGRAARREEFARNASDISALRRMLPTIFQESVAETPTWINVAEEFEHHTMAEGVPPAVAAEIEACPDRYPGVRTFEMIRRAYPMGTLASHVLGHLASIEGSGLEDMASNKAEREDQQRGDLIGVAGVEQQYESLLRARRGLAVELTDHGGRVLSSWQERTPCAGRDVRLTLDSRLQRAAEELLDDALERRKLNPEVLEPAGGAIVVMNVGDGAIVASASAPRFDPTVFVRGDSAARARLLTDPRHPLFDRVSRMALPPGSVFKVLTAIALLEAGRGDPAEPFFCQGFLKNPEQQRCAIYVRRGVGHGEMSLLDALTQSCNVYFFHHAGALGPAVLGDWAARLGFGRPTGVDLPGEAPGRVPTPETIQQLEGHVWQTADTQAMAVGQGSLTATPLQVARMMAAVANGGLLVTPHVARDAGLSDEAGAKAEYPRRVHSPQPIPGLHPQALAVVREGLRRVVADPQGTAYNSVYMEDLPIAGKTGTAVTGEGRADHAWFAGYFPADNPKFAVVVALEHSGDAAIGAGPIVKRLALQMRQLGMLSR